MILSVGYRVKSNRGIQFRIWANRILKNYIMKGYAVNKRFERLENRVTKTEKKIDFFVKTALPPVQGIFYEGQIFDAYIFATNLIKSAKKSIVLIDNFIDEPLISCMGFGGSLTGVVYTFFRYSTLCASYFKLVHIIFTKYRYCIIFKKTFLL
jgi:hypothetical protein